MKTIAEGKTTTQSLTDKELSDALLMIIRGAYLTDPHVKTIIKSDLEAAVSRYTTLCKNCTCPISDEFILTQHWIMAANQALQYIDSTTRR